MRRGPACTLDKASNVDRHQITRQETAEKSRKTGGQTPVVFSRKASRWILPFALGLATFGFPLLARAQRSGTNPLASAPDLSLTPPPVGPSSPALPPAPPPAPPPVSPSSPALPPPPPPAPVHAPTPAPIEQPAAAPVQAEPFPEEQPAITMRLAEMPLAKIIPEEYLMDWGSFGLRLGYQLDSLKAAEGYPPLAEMRPFSGHALTVALTAHFGRSGYFTRLDVPAAIGQHTYRAGIGFYPIGLAYLFPDAGVMPYLGAGALGGMLYTRIDYSNQSGSVERRRFGVYSQVRTMLGIKVFPIRQLALSFEIGYSPYLVGYLPQDSTTAPKKTYPGEAGVGMTWDTNIGVEWH